MQAHTRRHGLRTERGFVLVSVIWIAGLLAVMATAFTIGVRSYTLAGRNVIQGERAQAVADGMAMFEALKLASLDLSGNTQLASGIASICQWAESAMVTVRIQDQGGLVDLNTASPVLVERLFAGLRLAAVDSTALQASLRDHRDPDHDTQAGGLEPEFYPGRKHGPKNAPLSVAEELDQIPGLTDKIRATLRRVTTVSSQQIGIDVELSPIELLKLLHVSGPADPAALAFASPSPRRIYSIEASTELPDGSRFTRRAMIALLRQPERPFAILAWQQGVWSGDTSSGAAAVEACLN